MLSEDNNQLLLNLLNKKFTQQVKEQLINDCKVKIC